jgi:hypothetical protein
MEKPIEMAAGSAELNALASEAAVLDMETAGASDVGPAPAPGQAAAPVADPVAETAAMFGMAIGLLSPLLPYLPAIYTTETVQQLAGAYVPVAEKYGWASGGGIFEKYGPELMLAGVAVPLAVQTAQAHKAWAAERAKTEEGEKIGALRREADAKRHLEISRGLPDGALDGPQAPAGGGGDGMLRPVGA